MNEDPTLIRCLRGHKQSVTCLTLHPICKYIASAGMDNSIFLWDLTKKVQPCKLTGHKNQINDLKFNPNGNIMVSASSDESLKFWEVDLRNQPRQATIIKAHHSRIRSVAFSCDGLLLSSCGDDKLVKIWSTIDRRHKYTLKKHENWVRYCQFSPTANNLVSCDDKVIQIWDLNTKKPIQSYQEHTGVIHQAKFHSLGNCLVSCSHDKKIKLYDLRSQHVIQVYEGHQGPIKSVDFHPHCPYIISSSDDGTTKIWNSQKGKLEYTLQSHSNATQFSRQGDYFVSAGSEKTINIWKTGFYDSLKEKISGVQSSVGNRKLVLPNTDEQEKEKRSEDSMKQKATQNQFTNKQLRKQPQNVLYNHEMDHFQLINKQDEQSSQFQSTQSQIIPRKLTMKLQRINNQIDFITKTTQILETRVMNNGQQLQRIISIIDKD